MTYILNVIPLGSRAPIDAQVGIMKGELDDPPSAFLTVGGQTLAGVRYLVVTDDGYGYWSSDALVRVPRHSEQSTVLSIPDQLSDDFRKLLEMLAVSSPERRLAIYLEANRAISRQDPTDMFPVHPALMYRHGLADLWGEIARGEFEEEEVRVVTA